MILGVGSDLVDVRRIERVIARHGDRFILRIFTEAERAKADRRATRIETYAKRFAAKEACAKALGTGFRSGRVLARSRRGQPAVRAADHEAHRRCVGAAARHHAARITWRRIDLTITDEGPMAQALVIISAIPKAA